MALARQEPRCRPSTPLLSKGDDRYAERTARRAARRRGRRHPRPLHLRGRDDRQQRQPRRPTTTATRSAWPTCPSASAHVPELYCQRKFGLRALEGFEDAFRGSKERVELESEALDENYEIFAGKKQDANWLRQLFSPTFIVWLTDAAPKKFAFELVDGTLCCYVNGHKKKAEELDGCAPLGRRGDAAARGGAGVGPRVPPSRRRPQRRGFLSLNFLFAGFASAPRMSRARTRNT